MSLRRRFLVPLGLLVLILVGSFAFRVRAIRRLESHTAALQPLARLQGLLHGLISLQLRQDSMSPRMRQSLLECVQQLRDLQENHSLPDDTDLLVDQACSAEQHPEIALRGVESLQARVQTTRENDLTFGSWLLWAVIANLSLLAWLTHASLGVARVLERMRHRLDLLAGRLGQSWVSQQSLASQQALSGEQAAHLLSILSSSLAQVDRRAEAAAEGSARAEQLTQSGLDVVETNVELYRGLQDKFGAVAAQMLRLSEQVSRITAVTRLTRELSAQTNILALNASVEAARAGEHGSGFAVVAAEIRELANQSRRSGEEISELVTVISAVNDITAMTTEEGTRHLEQGNALARQAWDVFHQLHELMVAAQGRVVEVSQHTRDQREAMLRLDRMVGALARDALSLAQEIDLMRPDLGALREASLELNGLVGRHD